MSRAASSQECASTSISPIILNHFLRPSTLDQFVRIETPHPICFALDFEGYRTAAQVKTKHVNLLRHQLLAVSRSLAPSICTNALGIN